MSGMNKLNIRPKARRRVQMRSVLLLTLWAFFLASFVSGFLHLPVFDFVPGLVRLLLEAALTAAGFGGAAYVGVFVLDGRHPELIPARVLSPGQILWYGALGVLAIAPMSLCQDVLLAFMGGQAVSSGAADASFFLPMLLKSALLAPIVEELFFRGYLQGALARYGKLAAAAASALIFALMHGGLILPHAALGLLLGLIVLRTDAITAAMLVHGGYNLALLLVSYSGLDGWFTGLSFASCALRVGLSLAFVYALRRAVTARETRVRFSVGRLPELTKRERALLAGAAALVLLAAIVTGVLA